MSNLKRNKVVIQTIAFSPDGVSTAYLYNDIALRLQKEGLEVVVLTTTPHFNQVEEDIKKQNLKKRWGGLYQRSYYHGIKVLHVPQKKFKSTFLRMLGFVYWHIVTIILGLTEKRIGVILSPSPPLTLGIVAIMIAKLKGAKCIYNVQEIYPDFIINQGKLKFPPAVFLFKFIEKFVYNNSDRVTTIDQVFYNKICDRFADKTKLKIIPNFVDTELYCPVKSYDLDVLKFPNKPDVLKIMYAGNIGHAQDWEPLLKLSKMCEFLPVEFWVIGEGVKKKWLTEKKVELGISNIHIIEYQERNLMPQLISYADLHFIFMAPTMENDGFPSKVYSIMSCEKPLLIVSSDHTPLNNFLKDKNVAYIVNEQNDFERKAKELFDIIAEILADKQVLITLGGNGRKIIEEHYSKEIVTGQYYQLISELMNRNVEN